MNFNEYQELCSRTAREFEEKDRLKWTLVSALGLCGEAGEVGDYLKKVYGHDHPLDDEKLKKEIGDCLWYVADLCTKHNYSMEEVAQLNISKLAKRYPDGFDPKKSLNRKPEDV